jgi:hypothetical protein
MPPFSRPRLLCGCRRVGATIVAASLLAALPVLPAAASHSAACDARYISDGYFSDTVHNTHSASIDCMAWWEVARGTAANTYAPDAAVYRDQMASFLTRVLSHGMQLPSGSTQGFTDVNGNAHEVAINQLAELGVAKGTSKAKYSPRTVVRRDQMATYLVGAWEALTGERLSAVGGPYFTDTAGNAHAAAIDAAHEMGWAKGLTSRVYGAAGEVTRAQMAAFLARFIDDAVAQGALRMPGSPDLNGLRVLDADRDGHLGAGDSVVLSFGTAVKANSAITVRDADGDTTVLDDEAPAGTADGNTPAVVTGSGTKTVTFVLSEAADVSGGDGVLSAAFQITGASGISSINGLPWNPVAEGDTSAPAAPTASVPSWANSATSGAMPVSGSAEPGSTVTVSVDDRNSASAPATSSATADATGAYSTTVDVSTLDDGEIVTSATATDASANTGGAAVASSFKDTVAPSVPVVEMTDPLTATNQLADVFGTSDLGSYVVIRVDDEDAATKALTGGAATDGAGNYSDTIDVTPLSDGTATATVYAVDAAGNHSGQATTTSVNDSAAPAAPTVMMDEYVHSGNVTKAAVSGTAEADGTVSITVTDGTSSVTGSVVAVGGVYSKELDLSSLAEGGLTASATVTDASANTGPAATTTSTKDTITAVTVDAVPTINAATASDVTVTGKAEADATVTVTIDDANPNTLPVQGQVTANGTYSVGKLDVSKLDDGDLAVTVSSTDKATNTATASTTARKDTVAPAVDVTFVTNPINAASKADVAVSGTGENGASLQLVIDDADTANTAQVTATGTVQSDGTFSFSSLDTTALTDGTLTATVTAKDAALNSATDSMTATKDTQAPAVAVTKVTDPVTSSNETAVEVTGTGEAAASLTLVVDDADSTNSARVTATGTVDANGNYTFTGLDVTSLSDGTLTATVTAKDAAGNTAVASRTAEKDTASPVSITSVTNPVNSSTATTVSVSGKRETDAAVTVTIDDSNTGTPAVSLTVAADGTTDYTASPLDVSGLDEGALSVSVTATDALFNSGTASTSITKDTAAPTVTGASAPVETTTGVIAVTLSFNEAVTAPATAAVAGQFVYDPDGGGTALPVPGSGITFDSTAKTATVTFDLGAVAVAAGDTVSYSASLTAADNVVDTAGNRLANFTGQTTTNP